VLLTRIIWFAILWPLSVLFVWATTVGTNAAMVGDVPDLSFGTYAFIATLGWAIAGLCWLMDKGITRWENRE
jgi:hypothetical protein